ncbi:MAG: hypothetical protein V3T77_05295 [Planctomycetota bacterium]
MAVGFWLSGLDEAGYGPLLGPLVVALVTLRAEEPISPAAPWKLLAPVISHRRRQRGIAVADSKALHRPSKGDLAPLEAGVLAFLGVERHGEPPGTFRELVHHLTGGRGDYLDRYPWYADRDLELPTSIPKLELLGAIRRLTRRLAGARLEMAEMRAIPLEVVEFNRELQQRNSKGDVNAWAIGRLLSFLWRQRERQNMEAWSDQLGGRRRYGPLLYPLFPGAHFQILGQGEDQQTYRVEGPEAERTLIIRFQKGGEDHSFPTALASMTAKYLRELHMMLFNRWWQQHQDLRATAGYYTDARRFLAECDPLRRRLGVDDALLVRNR